MAGGWQPAHGLGNLPNMNRRVPAAYAQVLNPQLVGVFGKPLLFIPDLPPPVRSTRLSNAYLNTFRPDGNPGGRIGNGQGLEREFREDQKKMIRMPPAKTR